MADSDSLKKKIYSRVATILNYHSNVRDVSIDLLKKDYFINHGGRLGQEAMDLGYENVDGLLTDLGFYVHNYIISTYIEARGLPAARSKYYMRESKNPDRNRRESTRSHLPYNFSSYNGEDKARASKSNLVRPPPLGLRQSFEVKCNHHPSQKLAAIRPGRFTSPNGVLDGHNAQATSSASSNNGQQNDGNRNRSQLAAHRPCRFTRPHVALDDQNVQETPSTSSNTGQKEDGNRNGSPQASSSRISVVSVSVKVNQPTPSIVIRISEDEIQRRFNALRSPCSLPKRSVPWEFQVLINSIFDKADCL